MDLPDPNTWPYPEFIRPLSGLSDMGKGRIYTQRYVKRWFANGEYFWKYTAPKFVPLEREEKS